MKTVNKKFYTLKQVSKITNIPIHTLKFWKKEFKMQLKQNSTGRKIFSQGDIDCILLVKHLRQKEKLTLIGIKKRILEMKRKPKSYNYEKKRQCLLWVQKELLAIRNLLQQSNCHE